MYVLGINGGTKFENEDDPLGHLSHDASAVLLRDGEIVAAIEEERLSRFKHSNSFPARAIQWCMASSGISWTDIDRIAMNISRTSSDAMAVQGYWRDATDRPPADAARSLSRLFERAFGIDVSSKLRFCHHHEAHAWSAFIPSGFERSLVISIDGDGEDVSGMVFVANDRKIARLREYGISQSLGHLYLELTRMLGYWRFDEYKVMGLAPYGNPATYGPVMDKLWQLLPNGEYRLAGRGELVARLHAAGLLSQARKRGESLSQVHIDFAAALQAALEKVVLHVARHFREQTAETNLCLVGGVAHNCSANGKLLASGLFERIFVQPAAHDAGGAMGAAWKAYYDEHPTGRRASLNHVYFGSEVGTDEEVSHEVASWGDLLESEPLGNAPKRAAALLAEGSVVAWMQGRSEFGPRALGNRSILADPRPATNKQRINDLVKKREAYRPFAPAVLQERIADYFHVPLAEGNLPFMVFVLPVREERRAELGAITHVDGTARVQTVSRDTNPRFWHLIEEFERLTGVAVVLNTSFNNHAEPIVDSVRDAIVCLLTTDIEYLIVGDLLVRKGPIDCRAAAYEALAPRLPLHRKLVRRPRLDGTYCCAIESVKSSDFGQASVPVSDPLFHLLQRADGATALSALLACADPPHTLAASALVDECLALWSMRVITLHPVAAS